MYYGSALKVREMWQAKARALNIPLSAKGHADSDAVGQRGAFTGLAIDTHKGRFHMLPEKLASMVSARDDLAAAALSTPRIIARVRGKALHYWCTILLVTVAAPSLSQLMHNRETCTGQVAMPSLDEEKEAEVEWDRELRVSERARRALEFMRAAMEKYGNVGQPLWPVVLSSLMGHSRRVRSVMLASCLSHSTPACTAGLRSCARPWKCPVLRSWEVTGPRWTCLARNSSALQRSRTARRRRCTWRHLLAFWRLRRQVSCTRSLTTPF